MVWNTFAGEDSSKERLYCSVVKLLILLLIFSVLGVSSGSVNAHSTLKKSPHRSQFTEPPSFPPVQKPPCNIALSPLKAAMNCFDKGQLKQANTLFTRVKSQAISADNHQLLIKSNAYLALIAMERGQHKLAVQKVKHLFFLQANFRLQQLGINEKKYQLFFKKIKNKGRNLNEKEVDDISGIAFIRVKSCRNRQCKNGIWQQVGGHNKINDEINCSLQGNCVDDIKCSLEGTCNKKAPSN